MLSGKYLLSNFRTSRYVLTDSLNVFVIACSVQYLDRPSAVYHVMPSILFVGVIRLSPFTSVLYELMASYDPRQLRRVINLALSTPEGVFLGVESSACNSSPTVRNAFNSPGYLYIS